jgi:inositol-phosphate transport system substrate-binding protein
MGGEIVNEEGNLVADTEAIRKVYALFEDLRDRGVSDGSHLGLEWADWHTFVSSAENVLFWAGGTWNWGDWAVNYVADTGGEEFLFENIGLALVPALETGVPITLTHPLAYMISSSSDHPDVAMALIAAITTPELNNRHAIDSAHLGILNTQLESEAYQEAKFLSMAHPMLDFTTFLPNHPQWGAWSEAYWTGLSAVENGDLSADEAVDVVIDQMQNEIENLEVR